jgi:hypothetical protein
VRRGYGFELAIETKKVRAGLSSLSHKRAVA